MSQLHSGGADADRYIVLSKCYGAAVCCRSSRNNQQWKQGLGAANTTNRWDKLPQLYFLLKQCHVEVVWAANMKSGFSLRNSVTRQSSLQHLTCWRPSTEKYFYPAEVVPGGTQQMSFTINSSCVNSSLPSDCRRLQCLLRTRGVKITQQGLKWEHITDGVNPAQPTTELQLRYCGFLQPTDLLHKEKTLDIPKSA